MSNSVRGNTAAAIIGKVAAKIRRLKDEMETSLRELEERFSPTVFRLQSATEEEERRRWLLSQREKSRELQIELDPLIYEYFGIKAEDVQEVSLIQDTCDIFGKSATPPSLAAAKDRPTLKPLDSAGLEPYAEMLTETLNSWVSGSVYVSACGDVNHDFGLALVEVNQTKTKTRFRARATSVELIDALHGLQEVSTQRSGSLEYLRGNWVFDDSRILIVKPALFGQWTRTAAINDAADIYAHIAEARRRSK